MRRVRGPRRVRGVLVGLTALVGAACGGSGGPAGGPDAGLAAHDAVDHVRDLSAWIEDGWVKGLPGEPPTGGFPVSATLAQIEALRRVNEYRAEAKLAPVRLSAALNESAAAACPVAETTCEPDLAVRLAAVGLASGTARESTEAASHAAQAVDRWFVGLYDRLPILHGTTEACGYAESRSSSAPANVMDYLRLADGPASGDPADAKPVLWPKHNARNVGTQWGGQGTPQPPAPSAGYPSGPVVTMTWPGVDFRTKSHELLDGDGAPVEHLYLDPASDPVLAAWDSAALYAQRPLQPATSYLVVLTLDVNGRDRVVDWSFKTRGKSG